MVRKWEETAIDEWLTNAHASDGRDAQVRAVHQRDSIHEAQRGDQTEVDAPDDLLLLLRSESIDVRLIGEVGLLRDGLLEVTDLFHFSIVDDRHRGSRIG